MQPLAALAVAATASFLLSGCGRTGIELGISGAPPNGSSGSGIDLCTPHGIRLCQDPRCPLAAGACPGIGCTPSVNRDTGQPEDAGVCWLDVPTFLKESCTACPDGQVCVHQKPDVLVCVPFDVCVALNELGAVAACRYADKTAFTGAPLAESISCPAGLAGILCGGGCGECPSLDSARCTGRSASRANGVCVTASGQPYFPCSVQVDGTVKGCVPGSYCAIFADAAPDDAIAKEFGFCLFADTCVKASSGTPLLCLDQNGMDHAP